MKFDRKKGHTSNLLPVESRDSLSGLVPLGLRFVYKLADIVVMSGSR